MPKYIVKRSRTLRVGGEVDPKDATKKVPGEKGRSKTYGPGEEVTLEKDRGEKLIARGILTRPNTEAAQAAKEQADELPADFPGHAALLKAGYDTRSKVAALSNADLVAIEGIGETTAGSIQKALKAK